MQRWRAKPLAVVNQVVRAELARVLVVLALTDRDARVEKCRFTAPSCAAIVAAWGSAHETVLL